MCGMRACLALICVGVATVALADVDPPVPVMVEGGALTIDGSFEVVFDWSEDRCVDDQVPDLPVRAYRGPDGDVILILSHHSAYQMTGPDFDTLAMDCTPVMISAGDPDPAHFAHYEWLAAIYAEEDGTIHGLVHNEHHGHELEFDLCPSGIYAQCWYNSITQVRSEDGRTFVHAAPIPDHFVAGLPLPYEPDVGPSGMFSPSNILRRGDHYYAFVKTQLPITGFQHVCLMRSADLDDPTAWRFWDGRAFEGRFADPYRADRAALNAGTCPAIALEQIAQMYEGVSWNNHLQKYVLIGTSSDPARPANLYGFYYALSDDLITWERRKPLLEARLPWRAASPHDTVYLYPTLIDHDSDSRNFETTGEAAYLYFTRLNNGPAGLDRDLIRVRVRFRRDD